MAVNTQKMPYHPKRQQMDRLAQISNNPLHCCNMSLLSKQCLQEHDFGLILKFQNNFKAYLIAVASGFVPTTFWTTCFGEVYF